MTFGTRENGSNLRSLPRSTQMITRREPRYDLCLPVSLRVSNSPSCDLTAMSENISVHGVLLATQSPICEGTDVQLTVTFAPVTSSRTVRFVATGRVLRLQRRSTGGFAVAVSCAEHPFTLSRTA